ncbi:MAG: hypothetical protein AABX04_03310 [Nanoarchaeota archaeon]
MATAKAKITTGKLKAKVKYPLVGGAELEIGPISKLTALVKVPFLFSAKLFGFLKLKKRGKEK